MAGIPPPPPPRRPPLTPTLASAGATLPPKTTGGGGGGVGGLSTKATSAAHCSLPRGATHSHADETRREGQHLKSSEPVNTRRSESGSMVETMQGTPPWCQARTLTFSYVFMLYTRTGPTSCPTQTWVPTGSMHHTRLSISGGIECSTAGILLHHRPPAPCSQPSEEKEALSLQSGSHSAPGGGKSGAV